jgi:hypothetical protein
MTAKQAIKAPDFIKNRGIQRYRPPRIGPKQEDLTMKKDNPFHTLAEALEAGEPPLIDKIIGERDSRFLTVGDEESPNLLKVERVFCTASGGFVILARPRTEEEEAEKEQRHKAMWAEIEKAEEARITAAMERPGYILIAWQYTGLYFKNKPTVTSYYLPKTGPRYVYCGQFQIIWEYAKNGCGYKTAKQDGYGLSRWGRREIAEGIKQNQKDYRLCAPLWLLTSIPDPRPRFLCPVIE